MAKASPAIVIVGVVVENKVVSGTSKAGEAFQYNKLTITTQNGRHWDTVKPRSNADEKTLKVFETAKKNDVIAFSDCFLSPFVTSKGKPCVDILAGQASK